MAQTNESSVIPLISITGTESTGKTELAVKLAAHYQTVFVPDYSRQYVEKLDRKYNHSDVLHIAKAIIEEERKKLQYAHRMLLSDNCLINIKIWLRYYKWHVPEWLDAEIVKRKNNLHLLCDIDVAWTPDEQRKNPHDREELFAQFKNELEAIGAAYRIVSGRNNKRTRCAIEATDFFLANR